MNQNQTVPHQKQVRSQTSDWIFLLWAIPSLWLILLGLDSVYPLVNQRSHWELQTAEKLVHKFVERHNELPTRLSQLRPLAHELDIRFSPYDRYGERLGWTALNEKAFIVQSFGREQKAKNLLLQTGDFVLRGTEEGTLGVQELTSKESLPILYQPAFLEGLLSPRGYLLARLYTHPKQLTRHLVVTAPKNHEWIQLSLHDKVSEFLWLKSGYEIIFTAENSAHYDGGLYYWNLTTGEEINLWPKFTRSFFPQEKDDQEFFLSLSHVSDDPPLLYFLAKPKHEDTVKPKDFYSFAALYALTLEPHIGMSPIFHKIETNLSYSIFDYPLHQAQWTKGIENARSKQQKWAKLPLKGDLETVFNSWQEYGVVEHPGPMTPYHLWWLASLYNDAFRILLSTNPAQARVVRNFGIEMADALQNFPLAPSYLQAMAGSLKKSLLTSKAAEYSVTQGNLVP